MSSSSFRLPVLGLWLILTAAGLTACGQTMMATPVMFDEARIDPFSKFDESQRTNEVTILYATNRSASGPETDRHYKNKVQDDLALGEVTVRLGSKNMTWDELYEASTSAKRKGSITLHVQDAVELAVIGPDDDPLNPPAGPASYADRINTILADKPNKNITIYIHGANVDFTKSSCTAAEFHHFMGRHGIMISFDWPSTQSVITYGIDVKHAAMSVEPLTRFLEYLAANTNVARINLIGYSAGAQVLSPAMYNLRERYGDLDAAEVKEKLRIGEIYFAAPDVDLRTFVLEHAPRFHDMALSTTVTINLNDSVLALSQLSHFGKSRAGRPDIKELSLDESELVIKLVDLPTFNVIDMSTSDPPTEANLKGHGYWYKSPWVSTDLIIQLIFHASPAQRGLEIDTAESRRAQVWYYPDDYPDRVVARLKAYLAGLPAGQVPVASPAPR